jgi:hypothetical protein
MAILLKGENEILEEAGFLSSVDKSECQIEKHQNVSYESRSKWL